MRILRLTNSNDLLPTLPGAVLASAVAERIVAEATGQPVETVMRAIWPSDDLPAVIEKWLHRYEPDVVFIRASSFWVAYESVPLRLQRRYGRIGRLSARAGFKAGENPSIATSRLAQRARRLAVRAVGGDTHFTPESATRHVADALRVVLKRESAVPVLRGPAHSHNSAGNAAGFERSRGRADDFDRRLAELCEPLHVSFVSARSTADDPRLLGPDDLHDNELGQRVFGELEGKAIAGAWARAGR